MTDKTQNNLLLILGGFTIVGLVYYAYKGLPFQVKVQGIQTMPQSNLQALAQRLHEDIDGLNVTNHVELYQQALALPDGDLIRLYNIYNQMFSNQDGETFTEAVAGEWAWIGNYSFMVVRDELLARCAALNLP